MIEERRKSREKAFILLFEYSFLKDISMEKLIEKTEVYREALANFTKETTLLVETHLEEIDKLISENLMGWKLSRISKTSLAILRLATCELCYNADIPDNIAINEAIEIAKEYCDEDEPAFINGVLGSIERSKNKQF